MSAVSLLKWWKPSSPGASNTRRLPDITLPDKNLERRRSENLCEELLDLIGESRRSLEHSVEALEALAENAFGPMSMLFGLCSTSLFQVPPPAVAHGEGHRQHAHQFLDPFALGHVGVLELVAPLLQMAEEGLDPPAQAIEFQCLGAMKSMADDREVRVASFGDTLGGEVHLPSENLVEILAVSLPASPPAQPSGAPPTDERVALDPHDVAQLHQLQPSEPMLSDKLPVHGQHVDVFDRQDGKHLLHQGDPVGLARVAALGGFGQDTPRDGKADLPEDHGDDEDVDVGFAELPIGAVHGEDPALWRPGGQREDEGSDLPGSKHHLGEEALEAAQNRFALGPGAGMLGKPGQRDGALTDHGVHQHREAAEAGLVEGEMRLDPIKESLQGRVGSSGWIGLSIHHQ